jgi:hypothetical protein
MVTGFFQNGRDIFHHLFCLFGDATLNNFGSGRVDGDLSRDEQHPIGFNGLAVGANGSGGFGSTDYFFHVVLFWFKCSTFLKPEGWPRTRQVEIICLSYILNFPIFTKTF